MNNEVEKASESPSDTIKDETVELGNEDSRRLRKKYLSNFLFAFAFICLLSGTQAIIFYSKYMPRINETNSKLFTLLIEKTRGESLRSVQQQFLIIRNTLKGKGEVSSRFETIFEIMGEHFREGPLGTIEQVQSELQIIQEMIPVILEEAPDQALTQASNDIAQLENGLKEINEIYYIPYDQLHADLQDPPFYLWPTAGVLRNTSGYLSAVAFNRAIYMSQIGEIGTARVLLSGMFASSDEQVLQGLIFYSLGRLQWELFLTRLEPENYFQAVNYLRQSIQADPNSSLAKRLFDYMLSLTEAESTPGAGKGDPTTLTEGEAGAVQSPDPLF